MIKFDCGRAPGLEKRVRREADEADRTETKVAGQGRGQGLELRADLDAHCPARLRGAPETGMLWIPAPQKAGSHQHPFTSVSSAGHVQPSGETRPPSNPRVKDKD